MVVGGSGWEGIEGVMLAIGSDAVERVPAGGSANAAGWEGRIAWGGGGGR